ncbi:MAG: hypothetical protein AAFY83_08055 [Pseudomonadota bacterium]
MRKSLLFWLSLLSIPVSANAQTTIDCLYSQEHRTVPDSQAATNKQVIAIKIDRDGYPFGGVPTKRFAKKLNSLTQAKWASEIEAAGEKQFTWKKTSPDSMLIKTTKDSMFAVKLFPKSWVFDPEDALRIDRVVGIGTYSKPDQPSDVSKIPADIGKLPANLKFNWPLKVASTAETRKVLYVNFDRGHISAPDRRLSKRCQFKYDLMVTVIPNLIIEKGDRFLENLNVDEFPSVSLRNLLGSSPKISSKRSEGSSTLIIDPIIDNDGGG